MKRIQYKTIGEEIIDNPYKPLFGKRDKIHRFVVSVDVFTFKEERFLVVIDNLEVTFELVREQDGVTIFKYKTNNHVYLRRKIKEELESRGIVFGKEKRQDKSGRFAKTKRVGFIPPTDG